MNVLNKLAKSKILNIKKTKYLIITEYKFIFTSLKLQIALELDSTLK